VSKLHTRVRGVCALSIQRLEGSRWRLRQMRANGYGNSIFSPICKLLVLRDLENGRMREPQFDALRLGHDVRRIVREASAAPAASFKSENRTSQVLGLHIDGFPVNQDLASHTALPGGNCDVPTTAALRATTSKVSSWKVTTQCQNLSYIPGRNAANGRRVEKAASRPCNLLSEQT
jgi:hypothetical protein